MSDWPQQLGSNQFAQSTGISGSAQGLAITTNLGPNVKGTYTEFFSAIPFEANGLLIQFDYGYDGGNLSAALIDIGVGTSGSEQVIIPNLNYCGANAAGGIRCGAHVYFPIKIPAGSRVAARAQGNSGTNYQVVTSMMLFSGAFNSPGGYNYVDTYGTDLANSRGTGVDPGATNNVKGSWEQIAASTGRAHRGLILGLQHDGSSGFLGYNEFHLDIGIGGSGSEIVIVPDLQIYVNADATNNFYNMTQHTVMFPVDIPAGTRLAMRSLSEVSISTRRVLYASLFGVG